MTLPPDIFINLGVALLIGLLIGAERGWQKRDAGEGVRVAGLRTYGLLGLLGGGLALIAGQLGAMLLGFAFMAVAGVLAAIYIYNRRSQGDAGITSLVAGLLTFTLGALAALGEIAVAAAFAVITAILLDFKPQLHAWIRQLKGEELRAALQLLLISVVLLPLLPDRGYGPWQALNPYAIWWMVVLIAGISFAGYFAVRIKGTHKGIVYTGLFAGLASSTALTLHFSRLASREPRLTRLLATGILVANGTMFPRMLLLAGVINPALTTPLLLPVTVMTVLVYAVALFYGRAASGRQGETGEAPLGNPLELKAAIGFGILLAVIMLLGEAVKAGFGDAGVLLLAATSGIADVDAITLSLSRMTQGSLAATVGVTGIIIAAAVNSLVKAGIATVIGGRALGWRVGLPMFAASLCGLLALWLQPGLV